MQVLLAPMASDHYFDGLIAVTTYPGGYISKLGPCTCISADNDFWEITCNNYALCQQNDLPVLVTDCAA